jgi:hypothetical protein
METRTVAAKPSQRLARFERVGLAIGLVASLIALVIALGAFCFVAPGEFHATPPPEALRTCQP